jgi:hypothetical protein
VSIREPEMNWVTESREHVKKALSRVPKLLFKVSKEFAVDLLCKELEKIPVPFIGTILSKLVKEAAKSESKGGPSSETTSIKESWKLVFIWA